MTTNRNYTKIIIGLILTFLSNFSQAARYYVTVNGEGNRDGVSWGNASGNLSHIVNTATSGDEIWIASGTYKPSYYPNNNNTGDSRDKTFLIKDGVHLYGGFEGGEASVSERNIEVNETILSGDFGTKDYRRHYTSSSAVYEITNSESNAYHVVVLNYGSSGILIDGVTITSGNADGYSRVFENSSDVGNSGGGILCLNSNLTLRHSTIEYNLSQGFGGGIFFKSGSHKLEFNEIRNNYMDSKGYGTSKDAKGAGVYITSGYVQINACHFYGNFCDYKGGGLHIESGNLKVTNSSFRNNRAKGDPLGYGGAVWIGTANTDFINNVFAHNLSESTGGAIYSSSGNNTIINNTFYRNRSNFNYDGQGAAIKINEGSNVVINTLFDDNRKGNYFGDDVAVSNSTSNTFKNCLFQKWKSFYAFGGSSLYDLGIDTLDNLFDKEPNFIDNQNITGYDGDMFTYDDGLRLNYPSPAIDAGMNIDTIIFDAINFARKDSLQMDIGAYESLCKPLITEQPTNQSECLEGVLTLSIEAIGLNKTYQWYANDTVFQGQTSSTLEITQAKTIHNGNYYVRVTGTCGSSNSEIALIDVIDEPDTIYVDQANSESNIQDGRSWETAFVNLQNALDLAKNSKCKSEFTIWVAEGVYTPSISLDTGDVSNQSKFSFLIPDGTKLYGGFKGSEKSIDERNLEIHETILSGDFNEDDIVIESSVPVTIENNTENAWHVVSMVNPIGTQSIGVTMNGFVVSGGYAPYGGDILVNDQSINNYMGAGIYTYHVSLDLENSFVINNRSSSGAGVYSVYQTLNLTNTVIANNVSTGSGGGVYVFGGDSKISNTTFIGNTAKKAGGLYVNRGQMKVINTIFWLNNLEGDSLIAGADFSTQNTSQNIITSSVLQLDSLQYQAENYLADGSVKNYYKINPGLFNTSLIKGFDGALFTKDDGYRANINSVAIGNGTSEARTKYDILGSSILVSDSMDIGAYEGYCIVCSLTTSVDLTEEGISFFPNPTKGEIQFNHVELFDSFEIVNVTGQLVLSGVFTKKIIDISDLPNGLYFIKTKNQSIKVIKD